MEEKKTFKSLVLIAIILIVTAAIGAVFSSSILDYLKALATPLTALLITPFVTGKLEQQKRKDTEERNRQEALKDYLKQMTQLLVNQNLSQQSSGSAEVKAARALTLSVLRELDLERRKHLIDFLYEAELIQYRCNGASPSLLKGANLSELDLSGVYLEKADLTETNLKNAKLINAKLFEADLSQANLDGADLSEAKLTKAKFNHTYLCETKLNKAYLVKATLIQSSFLKLKDTDLSEVNFCKAKYDDETFFPSDFDFALNKMQKI